MNHAITKLLSSGLLLSAIFLTGPSAVAADTTTVSVRMHSDAVALTSTTALFTIDFSFITGRNEYRIPVGAARGLTYDAGIDYLGYDIFSTAGERAEVALSNAIVLADLPIEDGYYVLAPESQANFNLLILAELDQDAPMDNYEARFTTVPHRIGETQERDDVSAARQARFTTNSVLLNGPLVRINNLQVNGSQQ